MNTVTPLSVGIGNLPRCGWQDACNLKIESVEKRAHFCAKALPSRDDQRLCYDHGGNQDPIICREASAQVAASGSSNKVAINTEVSTAII